MLTVSDENIIISKETWEELRQSEYYRELIEAIEDRESLRKAKKEAEEFIDFKDYDNFRMSGNV